jgi:hypothetical protein
VEWPVSSGEGILSPSDGSKLSAAFQNRRLAPSEIDERTGRSGEDVRSLLRYRVKGGTEQS